MSNDTDILRGLRALAADPDFLRREPEHLWRLRGLVVPKIVVPIEVVQAAHDESDPLRRATPYDSDLLVMRVATWSWLQLHRRVASAGKIGFRPEGCAHGTSAKQRPDYRLWCDGCWAREGEAEHLAAVRVLRTCTCGGLMLSRSIGTHVTAFPHQVRLAPPLYSCAACGEYAPDPGARDA